RGGDLHAAALLHELRGRLDGDLHFFGRHLAKIAIAHGELELRLVVGKLLADVEGERDLLHVAGIHVGNVEPSVAKEQTVPRGVGVVGLRLVGTTVPDVLDGEVHRYRFASLDAAVAVAPAVVDDLVGVRENGPVEAVNGGADLGVGGRVAAGRVELHL